MDTPYDDETELTKYVWANYQHLFSRLERLGVKAVLSKDKAESATSQAMAELLRKKWGAEKNPEIVAALSEGTDVFQRRVRERVLRECAHIVFINRCPACSRIVRTTKAMQCLWCHHSWHKRHI
jgi:hypothetical protein